jgi:hypothetical protein
VPIGELGFCPSCVILSPADLSSPIRQLEDEIRVIEKGLAKLAGER